MYLPDSGKHFYPELESSIIVGFDKFSALSFPFKKIETIFTTQLLLVSNHMHLTKDFLKIKILKFNLKDLCEMDAYMAPLEDSIDILHNSSFKRLLDTTRHLKIPSNYLVRFSITSNDVLHSFAIPAAGIKIDAVPGRLNVMVTFFAKEALLVGQCSELCGAGHYGMPIVIECVSPNKFYAACVSDF